METKSYAEVEEQLQAHLSSANLSKDHLANISKSIAASYKSGLQIVDWWIYGIPAFERIVIQTQVPLAQSSVIQGLLGNAAFKGIDILRKGIPKPDYFQVNLTVEKIAE